jgi:formylglycine-generating enzyme required for sulfatase activity
VRCLAFLLLLLGPLQASASEQATAYAEVTSGYVTGITVIDGGTGYLSEPRVTLTGGGGTGATARAFVADGRVSQVIVLTAGSGYTDSPSVDVEAPPRPFGVTLELVPKLTVNGLVGRFATVERSGSPLGPWIVWTNVGIGPEGTVLVDLRPGSSAQFYRAISNTFVRPTGFVWIPPGSFLMGSPTNEVGRSSREIQHSVELDQGFLMSAHEVTQAQYESVMSSNPSRFRGANLPVETVTWFDAVEYCERLTFRQRLAGSIAMQQEYRLPTEAEWEYAARAGTESSRYGPMELIGWYGLNSNSRTHAVGEKEPNQWGLYDMIGNVREWCSDWLGDYSTSNVLNPTGPISGTSRIQRGGSWDYPAQDCRAATRFFSEPEGLNNNLGFRVVLSWVR